MQATNKRKNINRDMSMVFLSLAVSVGLVKSLPVLVNTNNNGTGHTLEMTLLNVLSRHRRSVNDTQATAVDSRSEIERFYDDPNNKAMFLVFPLFVLAICSCCGLYFCDKARKHFKKKKAEKKKRENAAKTQQANESGIEDQSENFPRDFNQTDSVKESEEITEIPLTDTAHCSSPLEDVENSPEVSAVNAVPIKHRETSFMTDVKQANSYNSNATLHNNTSSNASAIGTNIGNQNSNKNTQQTSEKQGNSKSNMNGNVLNNRSNSRPTSTESIRSMETNNGPVKKKVQITESEVSRTNNVRAATETTTSGVTTPIKEINKTRKRKTTRQDNFNSESPTDNSNVSIHSETMSIRTNRTIHDRTSPPDVTKTDKFPKMNRAFSRLSAEAIGEILQYYKDKKHMPDIIPDESENIVPIKKRNKRGKYRVFNG